MGLLSRIAFKATGSEGQDLDITGTVYNTNDEAVAAFSTIHQGMGFFELTPECSEYKIVVEHEKKQRTFTFNQIQPSGYTMRTEYLNETTLRIQLEKSAALPKDTLAFSISCRGTICKADIIKIGTEPYVFSLSTDQLPTGCLQFTLFDKQGNILAERLAFNAKKVDFLAVDARLDKVTYKPFEQAQMEINLKDEWGSPVSTTFSLAVRDAGTELHTDYQNNILTDLLLSSDIKGYVENPMQYFTQSDQKIRAKLDMLMMVQGWRRYNWQIMAGVVPFRVKYYTEEGLDISGKVLQWNKSTAKPEVTVHYWMTKDGASFHGKCQTDLNGQFHFSLPDNVNLKGKWPLGLQVTEKGKRKDYRILLDRSGPQGRLYTHHDTFVKDTSVVYEERTDSLKKNSITKMQYLEEVVIKEDKIKPDIVLDVEKDINSLKDNGKDYPRTAGEYLTSRVAAIDEAPNFKYYGQTSYICYRYKKPETPNRIKSYNKGADLFDIEDVYQIHIYYKNRSAWHYVVTCGECLPGPTYPAVFINVILYDDGRHDEYKAGIRQTFYDGYSQSKEFYHVDNSKKLPGEVDFRRTLYWNPNLKTDEEGKAKISFYNNSTCRKMSVSSEGITPHGIYIIGK